ncbi:MAG: trypsin-like peptidase domain-containing protein [Thermoproteota archaeon]|nr:trypsin-like peptidase domain-containing protein [Thermoproteota archaeon]
MIPTYNENLIINAIEKVSKDVVNIASVRMVKDQLLRIFPIEGVGSGVIIDKKGYILTNNHVIEKADKLKVTTTDGNVFDGIVVGTDNITDLAVIRIESKEALPFADLGNSDELRIGQIVIAIGNPFGLSGGPTVTAGIISALSRKLQFENGILELVQTDASINPGNSGGPLINTNGEIIAISTAKIPYAQGIGFAVPINVAKTILSDLIENGRVTNRPWLGISTIKITRQLARYYGLPTEEGALIAEVQSNSPADYSDLRKGDIIESIDGKTIIDPLQLSSNIRKKNVKDKVLVRINRYGRSFDKEIQLLPRPINAS